MVGFLLFIFLLFSMLVTTYFLLTNTSTGKVASILNIVLSCNLIMGNNVQKRNWFCDNVIQ